jgi:hypothetical protein
VKKEKSTPEQWANYLVRQRQRYAENKEERKARQRAYYARHREERIAYSTDYAAKNRERISTYKRTYDIENREVMNAQKMDSQHRRLADPATRAAYNALQKKYRDEQRPHKHAYRAKHGFRLELVSPLLELQGNACAICKRTFDTTKRALKPHSDHDHATGQTRGLLCFDCNVIEGKILARGLTPLEFGQRLHDYLLNPPARSLVLLTTK